MFWEWEGGGAARLLARLTIPNSHVEERSLMAEVLGLGLALVALLKLMLCL